jgi:hypothetical protein
MLMLLSVLVLLLLLLLQARELSELLDFAEQERLTLLEREAALQQELAQVRSQQRQVLQWCSQQHAALTRTDAAVCGDLLISMFAGWKLAAVVVAKRMSRD